MMNMIILHQATEARKDMRNKESIFKIDTNLQQQKITLNKKNDIEYIQERNILSIRENTSNIQEN